MSDSRAEEFVEMTAGQPTDDNGSLIDREKWSQRVLFKMYINYVVGNDKIPSWHDFLNFEEEMRSL